MVDLLALILARPTEVGHVPGVRPPTRIELRRRLLQTIDYLVAYCDRPLTLGEMARICGLSRYHFLRTFTAATGYTPGRFVTRMRLERAQALLLRTDRSVTDIALEVGFAEQSALSRAFSRQIGVSPRVFRLRARR